MKGKIRAVVSVVLAAAFFWLLFFYSPQTKDSGSSQTTIAINKSEINVIVADSDQERITGLSGYEPLKNGEGMLFVFDYPGLQSIWMKDMKFSLDIIWVDSDKTVVDMRTNVSPDTYPEVFTPRAPAFYVLEIPAGSASSLGIKIGDKVEF
jgi:hypothetical protein